MMMNRSTFLVRIAMLVTVSWLCLAGSTLHAQIYPAYAIINAYAGKGGNNLNLSRFNAGVTMDAHGNYYYTYADSQSIKSQVIKIDGITNIATIIAGDAPGFSGDGGSAISAQFNRPTGVVVDSKGNIYIADKGNFRIRKIDKLTQVISTIAGNGVENMGVPIDNQPAISSPINPEHIAIDKNDNIYFSDPTNRLIIKIDAQSGILTTVAGALSGINAENIPATQASLLSVDAFTLDGVGNIFIGVGNAFKKVTKTTGTINTILGGQFSGSFVFYENIPVGDMRLTVFNTAQGIAVDKMGNVYFALLSNIDSLNTIYKYNTALQTVSTLAGSSGELGFFGNGVAATTARLFNPNTLLVDSNNNLLVAQRGAQALRSVNLSTGIITSLTRKKGEAYDDIGDGQDADNAQLSNPRDVAVDADGNVYIADGGNQRIRKIDKLTHIITTVAGTGEPGFGGDGGPATLARFNDPAGIAFDNQGNLLIADRYNSRIRKVDKLTGIISTIAGNNDRSRGLNGIGGPAVDAYFVGPTDIVVDNTGNIYFSTSGDLNFGNSIFKIAPNGTISYFAGHQSIGTTPSTRYAGDNGPAPAAQLLYPHGLAIAPNGDLFFADKGNHVIRKVNIQTNIITTVAGVGTPGRAGNGGPAINAWMYLPDDISFDPQGNLVIADLGNSQIRLLDMSNNRLFTIAGSGYVGFSGDGALAANATFTQVSVIGIASNGFTYVSDQQNNRIRTFQKIGQGALPLTLINFRAAVAGQDALLQWSTTTEQNTASFNIERSADGKNNWQTIGTMAAAGNSSTLLNYSFTDNNTLSGSNYYRLRQVDLDLRAAYSPVILVNFRNGVQQEFTLYPNPVRDYVAVTLHSRSNSTGIVKIIDASGTVQLQKSVQLKAGNNAFTINNLGALGAGMYVLQVTIEGSSAPMVKKLLKM